MNTNRFAIHTTEGYVGPRRGEFTNTPVRTFSTRAMAEAVARFELGDERYSVAPLAL